MYTTKLCLFFFKGIKRTQQIMKISDLIQEIEFIRSQIRNQQFGQNGSSNDAVTPDLFGKIKQLLKKLEEALKQYDDAKHLLEEIETMIKQLEENINAKFESLTQMFAKWDKTLENVVDGIKNLDKRLQQVEKDLKEMNDTLDFGQAGFLFEQDVAKYVLPEGMEAGKINVYGNMIEWLNEEESEEEDGGTEKEKVARIIAKEEANKRWEEVKRMVDWNRKHENVLKYMKRQRIKFAHPPDVDLEHAKYLVKSHDFSEKEKECCLDIFTIIEDLSLRKSGTQSCKRKQPPRSCTTKKQK